MTRFLVDARSKVLKFPGSADQMSMQIFPKCRPDSYMIDPATATNA
ncbi:hypothetical protein GFS60_01318 [Rhodococcus sp. WAY2]|nr:hypothetical protein GFS60_01318 [Rhodococcus sp. WAY2]